MILKGKTLLDAPKPVTVTLTRQTWREGWGQKGMIAEVVSASYDRLLNMILVRLDYNKQKAHNLSLQPRDYRLENGGEGTAFDCGEMKEDDLTEEVYVKYEDDLFEIAENSLMNRYLSSGSDKPYVKWLEAMVLKLEMTVESLEGICSKAGETKPESVKEG